MGLINPIRVNAVFVNLGHACPFIVRWTPDLAYLLGTLEGLRRRNRQLLNVVSK
jgi:hypothetical protein